VSGRDLMAGRLDAGGLVQSLDLANLVAHGQRHNQPGRPSARGAAGAV
jgi:hypothetical protein